MKKINTVIVEFLACIVLLYPAIDNAAYAQPKPSISINFDFLPYQNFDDPVTGLEDAEIKMDRSSARASYPIAFSEGKTVLVNEVSYQYMKANYKNWTASLRMSLMLISCMPPSIH